MFMKARTRESASAASANDMPSGTSLLFPNGLRAHFGPGANDILVEILPKKYTTIATITHGGAFVAIVV